MRTILPRAGVQQARLLNLDSALSVLWVNESVQPRAVSVCDWVRVYLKRQHCTSCGLFEVKARG